LSLGRNRSSEARNQGKDSANDFSHYRIKAHAYSSFWNTIMHRNSFQPSEVLNAMLSQDIRGRNKAWDGTVGGWRAAAGEQRGGRPVAGCAGE
jgi:hypothetical protein